MKDQLIKSGNKRRESSLWLKVTVYIAIGAISAFVGHKIWHLKIYVKELTVEMDRSDKEAPPPNAHSAVIAKPVILTNDALYGGTNIITSKTAANSTDNVLLNTIIVTTDPIK